MSIVTFLLSIVIVLIIGAFILAVIVKKEINKDFKLSKEEEKTFARINPLNDYSFLDNFYHYSIDENVFAKTVSMTFMLKAGGIEIEKRLTAKSFSLLIVKVREWYNTNKNKIIYIDKNIS